MVRNRNKLVQDKHSQNSSYQTKPAPSPHWALSSGKGKKKRLQFQNHKLKNLTMVNFQPIKKF